MEDPLTREIEVQAGEGEIPTHILHRIRTMSIHEKMRLVNTTSKRKIREVLVKDPNQRIGVAVINSPAVTIEEIQDFARIRELHADVLTAIADHRRYGTDRVVSWALINNPKTPVQAALRLLRRFSFTAKELSGLVKNRDLSPQLRSVAIKLAQAKRH